MSKRVNVKTISFTILLFSCLIKTTSAAELNNQNALLNRQIQKIVDSERVYYQLPALSVSIKLPDEATQREFVSGFYDLSEKRKITPTTLFQVGSITKTFTASIIFKLIQENKLKTTDKLIKWLPQYPRWKNITVANLLWHTSGVYDYTHGKDFDNLLRKNQVWTLAELADRAYSFPDAFKPGKAFHYTNTDYILLGMIIEKITQKPLKEIFDNYFQQYHLKNTYYLPLGYSNQIKNKIASGYSQDGTFKFNQDVTNINLSFSQSAGAIISNPNDIVNFLDQLFSGKIISNASLAEMTRVISGKDAELIHWQADQIPNAQNSFIEVGAGAGIGLVYFRDNGFAWVHAGGMPGYESFYLYDPCRGIYLALMYNIKPNRPLIFIKIAENILQGLNHSKRVNDSIKSYQKNYSLPKFCQLQN